MDVERTIQSIVKAQARSEASLTALRKIVQQGMRMLVKVETNLQQLAKSHKELANNQRQLGDDLKTLAAAQKTTERTLQAFMNSLRNGRNGH